MTHSICTSGADGKVPYFQRLWRTLLVPDTDPATKLERLFEHETDEFDLDYAFLSHVDLERGTERFEIAYGSHELLKPRTTVPLSETYCRKTVARPEGTMAVSDAVAEGWEGDPAYERFEFGSYLGTTVSVGDELYGTLCFVDTDARDERFLDEEKALVEMHSRWVEYAVDRSARPPFRGTRLDAIEGRAVSPEAIDAMMDALGSRTRRVVLTALVGGATETSVAALERRIDHEDAGIRLYHTELPRLAAAGYIEWDRESDTVSRGSRFAEAEPLVRLLNEYNAAFPE